jgi:hypothetical protein
VGARPALNGESFQRSHERKSQPRREQDGRRSGLKRRANGYPAVPRSLFQCREQWFVGNPIRVSGPVLGRSENAHFLAGQCDFRHNELRGSGVFNVWEACADKEGVLRGILGVSVIRLTTGSRMLGNASKWLILAALMAPQYRTVRTPPVWSKGL